jgi:general secretion pathway protein G
MLFCERLRRFVLACVDTAAPRRPHRRAAEAGFSLIEILIVIAIIGLLVGLIGPNALRQFESSKGKTAQVQIEQLRSALDMYSLDVGRYPSQGEGLKALVDAGAAPAGWNGPYLRDGKLPLDPWGKPYVYAPTAAAKNRVILQGSETARSGEPGDAGG